MQKYVSFITNHRKPFFIVLVLVNILALIGVFQIQINSNFNIFTPEESDYKVSLDQMNQTFDVSDQIMFLLEIESPTLSTEIVNEFRDFQQFLEQQEEIQLVKGPTPTKIAMGPNVINIEAIQEKDLSALTDYYEMTGKLSHLTRQDGKIYGNFTLFPGKNFKNKNLNMIEDYLDTQGIQYYASGDLYMQEKIIDYVLMILLLLPPCALVLILTVFRTQMGSMKATFLSVLPAGIAALWTMGLVGWIGQEVSVITVLAPIFTIVIGSADGLHFVSHVQEARSDGSNRTTSIVETLKMVGVPMIITTITSMAGFLSLLVMDTNAIQDLAIFASAGIFLAGVATWYVLPLVLTGQIHLQRPKKKRQFISKQFLRLWGLPSFIILILVLVLAGIGSQQVDTEFNQLMFYREYTDVYQGFEKLTEINQGSVPVFLYAKTKANPLEPATAEKFLALEDQLTSTAAVGKAISGYDFYRLVYSAFNNQTDQYPDSMMQINMIQNMLAQGETNPVDNFINPKEKAVRMMIFPGDLKNQTLDQISQQIATFNAENPDITATVTGGQYLMRDLNESMIANQAKSLLLAFGIILALLWISLGRLKPALVSLLPIAVTVAFLYGFLGLSGISLNVFTTTIFSITIGVGIDYAIHFTSVWMSFRKKGADSEEAAQKTFAYTSRPILANAFGLAIGLTALLLSPLKIHLYVSTLMWVSMVAGAFLSLSFLPTILRKLK